MKKYASHCLDSKTFVTHAPDIEWCCTVQACALIPDTTILQTIHNMDFFFLLAQSLTFLCKNFKFLFLIKYIKLIYNNLTHALKHVEYKVFHYKIEVKYFWWKYFLVYYKSKNWTKKSSYSGIHNYIKQACKDMLHEHTFTRMAAAIQKVNTFLGKSTINTFPTRNI